MKVNITENAQIAIKKQLKENKKEDLLIRIFVKGFG